jgi:hypothetical protein
MNSNRRVVLFVAWSAGLYFLISLAGIICGVNLIPPRVNLVADILHPGTTPANDNTTAADIPSIAIEKKPGLDFTLYHRPKLFTNFGADTLQPCMTAFVKKLHELKTGKKRKVRIAYFGDSMIEGDLLTQTLRKLLQKEFGGNGVGFVPITSPVAGFRQTAVTEFSKGWIDDNFKEGKNNRLFLSGHSFHTNGAWVQIRDVTLPANSVPLEKSLLCGKAAQPIPVSVNNKSIVVNPEQPFNRIVIDSDKATSVKLSLANDQLPVYGISFESESGVFVDNFSFRGITGIEYARIDSVSLRSIADNNPYDLIVFQYGVNLLFRPNDKNFSWYSKAMLPVIRKMKNCFPESNFLLISTADRAFRYNGEYKTAVGMDSLIKVQAELAYQTNSIFYNQYATMGGENSIVEWAKMKPSLANQDYVHPNHRGAEVLAGYFFEALMKEYTKYEGTLK